ncbi:bifunctional glycosyltransferase/CDP-glycerol:glycerophosphate glycerophosphotransferase [Bacillus rubiinfantis]|uniref:bifunctional glycosyltransferase/CDP-glycerol:glycerophosphate glycerophosphotransferase n=1 Tax=Bacillus rubiinfantis TaxID=1499680 RepID=UPI0005A7858E|nr:CDP-glycerol glycerophosphotransferase family protein [Bacillus rubiinfantis]
MERKVSIIVPIYNVEQYLEDCIQSILEQDNFNFIEVLLIDDGSIDESSVIAKNFAEKYDNITYHYKENGGLSSARNFGFNLVTTPYVMFLDSDDKLAPRAVMDLYNLANDTKCPIVIGDLVTFPAETPKYLWKKYFGKGNFVVNNIFDFPDLIFGPSACNKIFDVEYLRSNNLSFPEGMTFEDAFAIIPLMLDQHPIAILDEVVYLYRKRDEKTSIMDSIYTKPKNFFDHLKVNEKLYNLIPENATLLQKEVIFNYIIRTYNGFLTALTNSSKDVLSLEEKSEIFTRLHNMYKNIPLYSFTKYLTNPTMRLVYFAIIENRFNLFLEPVIKENVLNIKDDKFNFPITRIKTSENFIECSFSIWIDFVSTDDEEISFYGLIDAPTLGLNKILENKVIFYFENPKMKKIVAETNGEIIRRMDYKGHEDAQFHGIKFSIPFKIFKKFPESYSELNVKIYDNKTKQSISLKVRAFGLLNRFKGFLKDNANNNIAYLNIMKDRSIKIRHGKQSIKKLIKAEVNKIFKKSKRRFNVGGKIRLAYWITYPFFSKKNIVLIGERRDTFQDNSSHLFRHVRKKHPKADWFYLLDSNSEQFQEANKLGNVIKIDSIKHYLYLLHAKKIINSYDLESYMIPKGYTKGEYLKRFGDLIKYKRIFLQHGIVYNNISSAASRYKTAYDLIVSSNLKETEFFIRDAHFNKKQIIQSGLPRYDRLFNYIRKSPLQHNEEKQILLMPTWRTTLAKKSYLKKAKQTGATEQEFMESDYYRFYSNILSDKQMEKFLIEHNATLNFYPHYEMHDFLHLFKNKNKHVKIIKDKTLKVQDLLIENDVLITDYSSVFFDFAFMRKPIVFTQFDYEHFYKTQYKEGYFSFANQGLGPVVDNIPDLIKALESIDNNHYQMTNAQQEFSKQFFDYLDESSICEKIYQQIEKL